MEVNLDEEIKSGELFKRETKGLNSKKWSDKWFVLTPRGLSWWNSRKDYTSKKRPKGTVLLQSGVTVKCALESDPVWNDAPKSYKCCFIITVPEGNTTSSYALMAQSEEDMGFWVDVLSSAAAGRKDLSKETVAIQEELRKTGVQEISPEALTFDEEVIGSGASGVVKRGMWLKTTEVAVKVLKNIPEFTDRKDLLGFYKEIETLSKLRHTNIVQMYGFCRKENYVCLVTEYVRGGNLADCLADPENYELDFYLQTELALNIVRGMVYLHSMGVIHRDLKPANILVESWEEGKVKVCDFGLSKVVRKTEKKEENEALGSPQYAAPELAADNHDNKVDVFSFGIILWEVAFRKSPWPELKFGGQFAERYQRGQRPEIGPDCVFGHLVETCWAQNPADRPAFGKVYDDLDKIKKGSASPNPSMRKASGTLTPRLSNGTRTQSSASMNTMGNPNKPLPTPGMNGLKSPPVKGKQATTSAPNLRTVSTANLGGMSPNGPTNGVRVLPSSPKPTAESAVWKLFTGKESETWDIFAATLQVALGTTATVMKRLKFVFETEGMVQKATWETFLIWFTPLDKVGGGGYDIDHVMTICTPSWFHGFLSSGDAQKALKGKPDGTYLFRFSTTNPGCYALTVAYSSTVGHWRISCEKKAGENPVFSIDGKPYKSLDDIIQTHRFGREPLTIKSPKPGQATTCFLGTAHPRMDPQSEDNELYQNVSGPKS